MFFNSALKEENQTLREQLKEAQRQARDSTQQLEQQLAQLEQQFSNMRRCKIRVIGRNSNYWVARYWTQCGAASAVMLMI